MSPYFRCRLLAAVGALALVSHPALAQSASTPSSANVAGVTLADVNRAFRLTTSLQADFVQRAANGSELRGQMLLKRPGRVRFSYLNGPRQLVVADGRTLSFVDPDVQQVSQWPLRQTALGVLLDPEADLAKIARILPDAQSPLPGHVTLVAEDRKKPEQGRIMVFLKPDPQAPGGLALVGWRVTDAQGNQTVVQLSNARTNLAISDSVFRFRDPRPPRVPGRPI